MLTFNDDSHLNPPTLPDVADVVIDADSVQTYANTLSDNDMADRVVCELMEDPADFEKALREFVNTMDQPGSLDNNQAKRDLIEVITCALQTSAQRNVDDWAPKPIDRFDYMIDHG